MRHRRRVAQRLSPTLVRFAQLVAVLTAALILKQLGLGPLLTPDGCTVIPKARIPSSAAAANSLPNGARQSQLCAQMARSACCVPANSVQGPWCNRADGRGQLPAGAWTDWRSIVLPIKGGRITCAYGCKGGLWQGGRHRGVDYHAAAGTPVLAPWSGVVTGIGTWGRAYGDRSPVIDFDRLSPVRPGLWGVLAHLEKVYVRPGERIAAGQVIGLVGMRGNATGPHLHFEIQAAPYWTPWTQHKDRDPWPWLCAVPAGAQPEGGGNGP